MQSSVLSGLSEGNSIYNLALENCDFNNIHNFYTEAGGASISMIDVDGRRNVYGPGIFHSGNNVGLQLQNCDACIVDGAMMNGRLVIDNTSRNIKIGAISCTGQTSSDIIDNGLNTSQLNANAAGYLNVNITGQLSDFSSIVFNGSLDRWVDATTPAGSWSVVGATMTRETGLVKQGISSALCFTSTAYPASSVRLHVPTLTTAISENRATATGWVYIPTSGGTDLTVHLWYDNGLFATAAASITSRDKWERVSFSFDVDYTGIHSSLALIFAGDAAGSFYLDGWSVTAGNAGGAAFFTPNAYEFVRYTGEEVWNPGTINNGAQVSNDITVLGASLGMSASAGAGVDVQDCLVSATVTAANTVTIVIRNNTGGSVTLGSSTWYACATNITI